MRRYNNVTPPSYPLHKATAPIALFWGDNDIIINNRVSILFKEFLTAM